MLYEAAKKHSIDLKSSYIVGDTKSDMAAGKLAGCATILITDNHNQELEADYQVDHLQKILEIIISRV